MNLQEGSAIEVVSFGVPRQPLEFVARIVRCGQPRSSAIHLPRDVTRVLESNMNRCDAALVRRRADFFAKWTKRAHELREEEAKFKAAMSPHLRKLLAPKRLLLFREILEELEFPDRQAASGTRYCRRVPNFGLDEKVRHFSPRRQKAAI